MEELNDAGLAKLRASAPLFAVHRGMTPFLVIHGTKDDQVPFAQSELMCKAMAKVAATCELIPIQDGGHGMGGWKAPEMQHWKAELVNWLKMTLQVK